MIGLVALLVLMLALILLASELFTNALEHLGARIGLSEGVTGSVFAAVGTALPETTVPLLALFAGTANARVNDEIGVGAILGAPLMLATLSSSLVACAVVAKRGLTGRLTPEPTGLARDLSFFLAAFVVAAAAMWVPESRRAVRFLLSAILCGTYLAYLFATLRASRALVSAGHGTTAEGRLMAQRIGLPEGPLGIGLQLCVALALLLGAAKGFIEAVQGVAALWGVSALLLSLLVIPIATEMPEKINSLLWVRRGKDTLALGNITGALVFQGTLLPALGILLTPWQPRPEVLIGVIATLCGGLWLRIWTRRTGMPVWALLINGALYIAYLGAMAVLRPT